VEGGLRALNQWVGDNEFIVDDAFSLADIAAGAVLGVSFLGTP
jgi:glutathione S-transferase